MGRKKDFWELADSTILSRNKKVELLKLARLEHDRAEAYRTQSNSQAEQTKAQEDVIEPLRSQLGEGGQAVSQELKDLMQRFDEKQRNHEQELSRLQIESRNWEEVAQDYKDVIVTQQTEINSLTSVMHSIKHFATMSPKEASQAFVVWLFGQQGKDIDRRRLP